MIEVIDRDRDRVIDIKIDRKRFIMSDLHRRLWEAEKSHNLSSVSWRSKEACAEIPI